jgi:hypothetical protein
VRFRGPQRRVHGLPITNRTHYAVSAVLIIFGFGVGSRLLIGEDGELYGMPSARAVGDGAARSAVWVYPVLSVARTSATWAPSANRPRSRTSARCPH